MKKKLSVFLMLMLAVMLAAMPALAGVEYPIATADKPITLTLFCVNKLSDWVKDYNETMIYQEFEKATGIHIEFIHPTNAGIQEQFNLMLVSEKMPDIIYGGDHLYTGGAFQGVEDGYFVNLRPYLEEYAPDYWELIATYPDIYRELANKDGVIAKFNKIKVEDDPPFRYMMLQQEMLDKLGVELPQTRADLENMFDKMLAAGITPFMLAANGYEASLMGMFDIRQGFYLDFDGNVAFGQVQPGFRQYLEMLNDWYNKGYLSKDFTNQSNTDALFDTGVLGSYFAPCVVTYNRGIKSGYTAVSAPYTRLSMDQQLHWETPSTKCGYADYEDEAVISTSCENIEAAVQWLNYRFTEPGEVLTNWGVEGVTFTQDENGKRTFTDLILNNPTMDTEHASWYYKMHLGVHKAESDVTCHANLLKTAESLAIRLRYWHIDWMDTALYLPNVPLNAEQQEIKSSVMNEVNTYVNEMMLKFIIGSESFDNWDTYVQNVWGLGLQDVIDVEAAAYETYLSVSLTD